MFVPFYETGIAIVQVAIRETFGRCLFIKRSSCRFGRFWKGLVGTTSPGLPASAQVREKLAVAQADWNAYAQAMCSVGNGTGETISSSYTCMWVCSQVGRSPKDPP